MRAPALVRDLGAKVDFIARSEMRDGVLFLYVSQVRASIFQHL